MLHAMLWNEIHALQSVPPPLPARATSACGYAPTRSTRAVARRPKRTKFRHLPSVGAASGVARETIQNTRYSSMPYAAHVRTGWCERPF